MCFYFHLFFKKLPMASKYATVYGNRKLVMSANYKISFFCMHAILYSKLNILSYRNPNLTDPQS